MNIPINNKKRKLHNIEIDIDKDIKQYFSKNESLFLIKVDNLTSITKKNYKNIKTEINNIKDDIRNIYKELEKNNMLLESFITNFGSLKINYNEKEENNKITKTNKNETFDLQSLYIS